MAGGRDLHGREQIVFRALLRRMRIDAGLRQQDLADRLAKPQSYVSKIESGERRLDVVELRRVCLAIGLTLPVFAERLEQALAKDEALQVRSED